MTFYGMQEETNVNVKEFERKEKNAAELSVSVTPEEFESAVQRAYIKYRGSIQIPGFRKGKAPRKIIENIYGSDIFYEEAVDDIAPKALEAGKQEKELYTVGKPTVLDVDYEEDKSVTIKFLIYLYPEITVENYKGLTAPKMPVRVTKKDVEREIQQVRERNARLESVDRPAENGDILNIDFEGVIDGAAFEGGKGEGQDLELGSGMFVPGFEEQLIGAKAGDQVDVKITFPENYTPDLASKSAVFHVKVNEVKEKILPELDDEFAKDVSEYDTLEEYTASVREELSEHKHMESDKGFSELIFSRLADSIQGDIPDAMLEEEVDKMYSDFRYRLSSQGMDPDRYMEMVDMDEESIRDEMLDAAEQRIRTDLALEYIAKKENLQVTEKDIEEEYQRMSEEFDRAIDEVKRVVPLDMVKTNIKMNKARQLVMMYAVPEKKEKKSDKGEDAE